MLKLKNNSPGKDRVIIFDIDDTLVQTINCKWLALKQTARKYYQLEVTDSHIKIYWGLPFEKMVLGVFSEIDSFETIKKHYLEISESFPMQPQEGAVSTIAKLKENFVICALTASSRSVILQDLIDAGFNLEDFYTIQTAEDTDFHKPDPRVFLPTLAKLEKIKISSDKITYVGDSVKDYLAACKIHINFIGVLSGLTSREEFLDSGTHSSNIIERLEELIFKMQDL